jgi:serine/threonine protein kinase
MTDKSKDDFTALSIFCEDDFIDEWEASETISVNQLPETRYQEKEHIASGGMKDIFKVYDSKMARYIALAQFRSDIPEEQCELFLKEVTLTASLEHPNIISVYDQGVNFEHVPYFTMELKIGDSLTSILKGSKVDLNKRLEIFGKICDAISYAHARQIIHLDLKPDNIQIGQFGEVQVCDWGLAQKMLEPLYSKSVKGTPGYMAPEQSILGQELNEQTDIYSLGAILFSLLTETLPLDGNLETVIRKTINGQITPPIERFPEKHIPKSLNAVVIKAMSLNSTDRYTSVDALKDEVSKFLNGRSTLAENAGFIKELSLFIIRNKQLCTVILSAMLIILLGTGAFVWKLQESKKNTESALKNLQETHEQLISSQNKERLTFAEKEAALEKYSQAREEQELIYSELINKELQQAFDLMSYPLFFNSPNDSTEKALAILKTQLNEMPHRTDIKSALIESLFISQKFTEVLNFTKAQNGLLSSLSRKYATKPRTEFGLISNLDFLDLLKDINELLPANQDFKRRTIERLICYMMDVRNPVFIPANVIQQLLQCWNPEWDIEQFSYDKEHLTLRLRGKELKKIIDNSPFSSNLCFLRFLKIETLDIRETNIIGLSQINGLNISKIDIRNTPINSLHPHNATKGIIEVILNKGQFDQESLERIPHSIKLQIR